MSKCKNLSTGKFLIRLCVYLFLFKILGNLQSKQCLFLLLLRPQDICTIDISTDQIDLILDA